MDQRKEKKRTQDNSVVQQKVFKFHNVSKDVILGTNKSNKLSKKNTKRVSIDITVSSKDDDKKKAAELMFKQYIPIRQECLPAERSHTKNNPEAFSTKTKSSTFCSQSVCHNKNLDILGTKLSTMKQKDDISNESEKPPGIKLVDITLLKEPSSIKLNPKFVGAQKEPLWEYLSEEDDAPLDLRKKSTSMKLPEDDQFPLDLSKKGNQFQFRSIGEPPPLMRIPAKQDKCMVDALFQDHERMIQMTRTAETRSEDQTNNVSYSKASNISIDVMPELLTLQPLQLVLKTNPAINMINTQKQIVGKESPSLNIQNKPKDNLRELVKNRLMEKARNKPVDPHEINTQKSQMQPIQMVFTNGQFVQVLPSQNILANIEPTCSNLNTISIHSGAQVQTVKKSRKIKNAVQAHKSSPASFIKPTSKQCLQPIERLSHTFQNEEANNNNAKNLNQNKSLDNRSSIQKRLISSPVPDNGMVKTNETVTSNGGIFCTFKNIKRMKILRTQNKSKRKKGKPS